MWNKIKQFWNWLGTKLGFIKQIEEAPQWPYADIHREDKTVYYFTGKRLESRLSRRFNSRD